MLGRCCQEYFESLACSVWKEGLLKGQFVMVPLLLLTLFPCPNMGPSPGLLTPSPWAAVLQGKPGSLRTAVLQDKPGLAWALHEPQFVQGISSCWKFLQHTSQVIKGEKENVYLAFTEKQSPLFSFIPLHYTETGFHNIQTLVWSKSHKITTWKNTVCQGICLLHVSLETQNKDVYSLMKDWKVQVVVTGNPNGLGCCLQMMCSHSENQLGNRRHFLLTMFGFTWDSLIRNNETELGFLMWNWHT